MNTEVLIKLTSEEIKMLIEILTRQPPDRDWET